jgi:hypothetical protein
MNPGYQIPQNLVVQHNKLLFHRFLWVRDVGMVYLCLLSQSFLQGSNQNGTAVSYGSTGELTW